jgi:ribosomal-protein-alanine N-acetyltransferase
MAESRLHFGTVTELHTSRLLLRGLRPSDFEKWSEVRLRCDEWLRKWEPKSASGIPDPSRDSGAFTTRCNARERERQLGTGYANALWFGGEFVGEINVNNVVRGAFQSAHVGYWIDERHAGKGFIPEGLVGIFGFMFDRVGLHRLQISIIPRNASSRRVVEKLDIRNEGLARGYLQIAGEWEDHIRYAITSNEWEQRREELYLSFCKNS